MERKEKKEEAKRKKWKNGFVSFVSGGAAGLAVDTTLFPLDTIKTRLQSSSGFRASGGFSKCYAGIGSAAAGSVPSAALFFYCYSSSQNLLSPFLPLSSLFVVSACLGELAACSVRAPVEMVKQRMQILSGTTAIQTIGGILKGRGVRGLYIGFFPTVMRDLPFAIIQFPLWELFRRQGANRYGRSLNPLEEGFCGSVAGCFAGGLTTPLDVIKTRMMIGKPDKLGVPYGGFFETSKTIWRQEGTQALFAGVVPRTLWISIGGFVFFGVYRFTFSISNGLFDN